MQELEHEEPSACRENRELRSRFLHEGLSRAEGRVFRAHLTSCPSCCDAYRETMASAAQVGRAMRESRQAGEREVRHEDLRRHALMATLPRRTGRRFGLRLMLLPVAFIVLSLWFSREPENGLVVYWDGGDVRAAGQMLSADRPELTLFDGDWCYTRGNARARIEGHEGERSRHYELGMETQLVVEDPSTGRVRLQQGELLVDGPCVVTTSFGVLEMTSGRASIGIRGGRCLLECMAGELAWTGPAGSIPLGAGERLSSERPY